jgi:hypothetical protein
MIFLSGLLIVFKLNTPKGKNSLCENYLLSLSFLTSKSQFGCQHDN